MNLRYPLLAQSRHAEKRNRLGLTIPADVLSLADEVIE